VTEVVVGGWSDRCLQLPTGCFRCSDAPIDDAVRGGPLKLSAR